MARGLIAAAVLYAVWVLLSGKFTTLLLGLGLVSSALVAFIAHRMGVLDEEGLPLHLSPLRLCRYWLWLLVEIIKSNIDVARRILAPSLPISPVLVRVPSTQRTPLARVIYANSITLTPGTVAINLWEEVIEVHALTREAARALQNGDMDRRVTHLEGGA